MSLEIEGKLVKILPEQSGEGKNGRWVKQDFVIETADKFPKKVCFSTWGDKTDLLKVFSAGDMLRVSFNPESREYNQKWYTDLRAWKIEAKNAGSTSGNTGGTPPLSEKDIPPFEEGDDGMPF